MFLVYEDWREKIYHRYFRDFGTKADQPDWHKVVKTGNRIVLSNVNGILAQYELKNDRLYAIIREKKLKAFDED